MGAIHHWEGLSKHQPHGKKTGSEFYGSLLSKLLLSDAFFGFTVRMARALDISTVRSYGKILANSVFLSKFLSRTYKLKEEPKVVYPGPDPIIEQLSLKGPSSEEGDYMLAVGSLIPLKNMDGVIRSAAAVPSARLLVLGDGQERHKLVSLAKELRVPIDIRGSSVDENVLARAYSECKFLVHLSLYEPFGLTPVEAGLFCKPSLVTNRGGPPETVIDGETGYVVCPTDHKQVSARMNELFSSPSLRREMGQKARKNITEKFTLEKSTKNLLAELQS